jgi:hypothetical protein
MNLNAQDSNSQAPSPCEDRISCCQVSEDTTIHELSDIALPYDVLGDWLWEVLCSPAITRLENKHGTIQDDFSRRIPISAGPS